MSEWIKYKLKDFAQLRKEQMIPNGEQHLYIGLEHIEQQSLRLAGIGSSDDVTSNKYKFHPYDTLYGKLRPYFRKVYHPKFEGICSTDILVIKNKDIVDSTYLFYLIASERFTQLANQSSTGTRMPRASWKHLSQTEWNIPPIPTQRQIAATLSSLDDKIELNLQMNQTLEKMAQAIFKEWFVDFNFPGFDGELVDGLPKGWRKGKVIEEFNLVMGQSPPGTSYNEEREGEVFYQGRTDFGARFPTNRQFTTMPKRMANRLDTLVSVRAPVGDINMANESCCIGRGLASVRHKSGAFSYTFYMMNYLRKIFDGYDNEGTVYGSINKKTFENIEILVPSQEVILLFEEVVNEIDIKILENFNQNISFSKTRDTLLPKLMSGQIEIA